MDHCNLNQTAVDQLQPPLSALVDAISKQDYDEFTGKQKLIEWYYVVHSFDLFVIFPNGFEHNPWFSIQAPVHNISSILINAFGCFCCFLFRLTRINGMNAHEVLSEEATRQLKFDVDKAYNEFYQIVQTKS